MAYITNGCMFQNVTMTTLCHVVNVTSPATSVDDNNKIMTNVMLAFYVIIFVIGFIGNSLVIYVVLWYTNMKTVTNMYILNLAISDILFLVSLPFLITTTLLKHWIFGFAMCKIYFVLFSINLFTSVFTLLVMSADRYMAVCHAVTSVQYRTPTISRLVCISTWAVSFLVMLPIILYSKTVRNDAYDSETCTIVWPDGQPIPASKAFTWYTFILGFAIPVTLISIFYLSVVLRLRSVGPAKKSKDMRKSHKRVTRMVLTVILVYITCSLPYWMFQIDLTFTPKHHILPDWKVDLFGVFTLLQFANSMLNPFLYAFLSENFRQSFLKVFTCTTILHLNKTIYGENSIFSKTGHCNSTHSMALVTSAVEGCDNKRGCNSNANRPLDSTFEPSCAVYTERDGLAEETEID